MGFRLHRRIKILPGVHLNLSKSGLGLSIGGAPFTVSWGPRGTRSTISAPGTGLSYVTETKSTGGSLIGGLFRFVAWALGALFVLVLLLSFAGAQSVYRPPAARTATVTATPFSSGDVVIYRDSRGRAIGSSMPLGNATIYRGR